MVSLHDAEKILKISLFLLAQLTNVTDGHRVTAYTALMHMHRVVKTVTDVVRKIGEYIGSDCGIMSLNLGLKFRLLG